MLGNAEHAATPAQLDPTAEGALDNPVWNCLGTRHAQYAAATPRARRFRPEFTALGSVVSPSLASAADLLALTAVGDDLSAICPVALEFPATWRVQRKQPMLQMIRRTRTPIAEGAFAITRLAATDVDDMLALVEVARPGPFRRGAIELGEFVGIREAGILVAMAGERMWIDDFRELSGVCTHPAARGRGLARALMARVVNGMLQKAQVPFLHVLSDNLAAIAVYENLGFERRIELSLVNALRMA